LILTRHRHTIDNVFDLTKDWDPTDVPLEEIGKICLTQNPYDVAFHYTRVFSRAFASENYFAEIEQAAFSPSHTVEGLEASEDPVLQSRLFAYPDAHRYRLGVNYQQVPLRSSLRSMIADLLSSSSPSIVP
jgi:catalase